ncbi:methyltransferase [Paractinoplanes globisporus]|uniref:Methyltransferase n=1 Tax=Paractinoplanes globisporus TaxID=113565 RepID=A0ABW6WY40_9ACTN|nr:methyltransferase [Actinoplanes globisporus]
MPNWYRLLVLLEIALAVVTFVALRFITAPYGRHLREGWGVTVPARAGWLVMESVSPLLFAILFLSGPRRADLVALVLLAMWQSHYLYRAFIYPFLLRGGRRMPVVVVLLAIAFNVLNASVNAYWVGWIGRYPVSWLADPRFLVGAALFAGGLTLHVWADRKLRRLRASTSNGYQIPYGGAYRWVSCPNYLGEIVEWTGWAIATWSPAGLAFALYTAANLAPRAIDHHAWYHQQFPDYPAERRALIPYVL